MKNIINSVITSISKSAFMGKIRSLFGSFKTSNIYTTSIETVDGMADGINPNPLDSFGGWISGKIQKILKKFGKRFRNEEKATTTIKKIASGVVTAVCVILTAMFSYYVIRAFIKVLPTVIYLTAVMFAIYIAGELITWVVNRGIGNHTVKTNA